MLENIHKDVSVADDPCNRFDEDGFDDEWEDSGVKPAQEEDDGAEPSPDDLADFERQFSPGLRHVGANIDAEEERRLIVRAKDEIACNARHRPAAARLLAAHDSFCWLRARRLHKRFSSLDIDDLVQQGRMGLLHAIGTFDFGRETRFLTYASWWIDKFIQRYGGRYRTIQKVPFNRDPQEHALLRIYWDFLKERHRTEGDAPLSFDEKQSVFDRTGLWPVQLEAMAARWHGAAFSLDAPIGEDGDITPLDLMTDGPFALPESLAERASDRSYLQRLMDKARLKPVARHVLSLRFGLEDESQSERTLNEIGERYGLTRERVRQIEEAALKKLKKAGERLKTFDPICRAREERQPNPSPSRSAAIDKAQQQTFGKEEEPDQKPAPIPSNEKIQVGTMPVERNEKQDKQDKQEHTQGKDIDIMPEHRSISGLKIENTVEGLTVFYKDGLYSLMARAVYEQPRQKIIDYLCRTGRPLAVYVHPEGNTSVASHIVGIFVPPSVASDLLGRDARPALSPLGKLSTKFVAIRDAAKIFGAVYLYDKEKKNVLAFLPGSPEVCERVKAYYSPPEGLTVPPLSALPVSEEAPQLLARGPALPTPPETLPALPLGPEEKAEGKCPVPLNPVVLKRSQGLANNPFDIMCPRDLPQALNVLFAAVAQTQADGQPVRVTCPGHAVIVTADPDFASYLENRAEDDCEVLGSKNATPSRENLDARTRQEYGLCAGFVAAAKGRGGVVAIKDTPISIVRDDGLWESYEEMRDVLEWAFPGAEGAAP